MKLTLSRHASMRILTIVLLSLIVFVGVVANFRVAHAATKKAAATPYYLETYNVREPGHTIQYDVHQYPWLTQTDNTYGAYHYPSQSVNMGWVDVYDNGKYVSNLAGTVDSWDKKQGSSILSKNSDINLTDAGNYFTPNSLRTSDNGWWPNDGLAWDIVNSPQPNCTITSGIVEAPWGDLMATDSCATLGGGPNQYWLRGYDRQTNTEMWDLWNSPQAQAFGHGFWQETTGITTVYSALHASDQAVNQTSIDQVGGQTVIPPMPAMPATFGPATFSNPAYLAAYNATHNAIMSDEQQLSKPAVRQALPALPAVIARRALAVLTVALGMIAVGTVLAAVGTYLSAPCPGNTNPTCWGEHTQVYQRTGATLQIIGGGMILLGSLYPGAGAAIWNGIRAAFGLSQAAEGIELTAAGARGGANVFSFSAVAAEEGVIANPFNNINF